MGEFRDPKKSMTTKPFNLARERMRIQAETMLKTAGEPKNGIWYWVWLKPQWKLLTWAFPAREKKDELHINVWPKIVTSIITPHYGLSQQQATLALELPYSMPRGRVTAEVMEDEGKQTTYFFIRNGSDIPTPDGKKRIENDFNLTLHLLEGLAEWIYDSEETMVKAEEEQMSQIIGRMM